MSFDGRITRLEREFGRGDTRRTVTCLMVIDDPGCPVDPEELEAFVDTLKPPDGMTLTRVHMSDNGRGDCGPHISYSGHNVDGTAFSERGPLIQDGHLVPRPTD